MKKTLITLAALAMASVASADTIYTTDLVPYGDNFCGGSYTMSFTLPSTSFDETYLVAYWGYRDAEGAGVSYSNPNANMIRISATDGQVTLTAGRGWFNDKYATPEGGTWEWYETPVSGTFTASGDAVYTLSVAGSNKSQVVSIYDEEGGCLLELDAYNGNMNGSQNAQIGTYGTIEAGMNSTFTPVANPAVPEPTTATLSLLALAGLAARRRRK